MDWLLNWYHEKRIDLRRAILAETGFRLGIAVSFLLLFISLCVACLLSGFPAKIHDLGNSTWRSYLWSYWSVRPLLIIMFVAFMIFCLWSRLSEGVLRRWVPPIAPEIRDFSRDRALNTAIIVITITN